MTTDIQPYTPLPGTYEISETPLRGRSPRRDIEVTHSPDPEAFGATDIIGRFRQFFDRLEAESADRMADPIAQTHALALLEALLADVRYVTATVRKRAADGLVEAGVRRLTIENVVTVEASSTAARTNWESLRLLRDLIDCQQVRIINDDGEMIESEVFATWVLTWLRPEWRTTAIRDAGLNADDYCDLPRDEDGAIMRTPAVTMKDNRIRKIANQPQGD